MKHFERRSWLEIDLNALEHNFREIKNQVGEHVKVLCVMKSDAYGHGTAFLVKEYEKWGADWFGVSSISEALQLRENGVTRPVLIFGYTPPEMAPELSNHDISQAVFSYDYALKLLKVCNEKNLKLKVHIKVDTGMSRIGFLGQTSENIEESVVQIAKVCTEKPFEIQGIFTHFAAADDITHQKDYTLGQFNNFLTVIKKLEDLGINIPLKHCCNSGGIINFPQAHLNMVRAGIALYGLYPSDEVKGKIDLHTAASLKSVISQIKVIPANAGVSYGRTFISKKEMKVATVPIGYADGYSRRFSNTGEILVCGKRAPVIGRVCMDQLLLDVSDIEEALEGDEVVIFGSSGGGKIELDELAKKLDTISYEIICGVSKRVPRIYYKNGEITGKNICI